MFKVGYTQGVFDMFHIGHLMLINRAAEQCERLIVGVNSDVLVQDYKKKTPVINEVDRAEIIRKRISWGWPSVRDQGFPSCCTDR